MSHAVYLLLLSVTVVHIIILNLWYLCFFRRCMKWLVFDFALLCPNTKLSNHHAGAVMIVQSLYMYKVDNIPLD